MLAEYTGAVLQFFYSDISFHALQNVQGGDEQGFQCYLNPPHTQQQLTGALFPYHDIHQGATLTFLIQSMLKSIFCGLKQLLFMQVFPTALEF